jgi:hypothetical protein
MKLETKVIKKLKIVSLAKVLSMFGIIFGIIYGIQMGFASMSTPLTFAEATAYATQDPSVAFMAYSIALGWWMLIVAPILFAVVYFLSGLIGGLLYNLFAKMCGGIKVVLE